VVDLDGDSDEDFVIGIGWEFTPWKLLVYQNEPGGAFSDITWKTPYDLPNVVSFAAGDVDGDDDVDLVIAEDGGLRVLSNHTRQLAWRGVPRVGKPLALDVSGPALEPYALALSPNAASIPFAPFGLLQLAPVGLKVVATGTLDANGQVALVEPMPAGPSAVGLTVYTQALVGTALRFTNLEIVTLTGF
jgi:hypothetical protein